MFQLNLPRAGRTIGALALTLVSLSGLNSAEAQTGATSAGSVAGRIDFAKFELPPATVEVDLSRSIFSDLFGLGDAAIEGVLESFIQSNAEQNSESMELAAGELAAVRQILQLSKEVIHEVHVRVYEGFPVELGNPAKLTERFNQQLSSDSWDTVVKVNEGNESVRVSFLRDEGSIRGVFAIVAEENEVVLVNLVCEISPENVKQLSAAATKIGLKLGLREEIERELQQLLH